MYYPSLATNIFYASLVIWYLHWAPVRVHGFAGRRLQSCRQPLHRELPADGNCCGWTEKTTALKYHQLVRQLASFLSTVHEDVARFMLANWILPHQAHLWEYAGKKTKPRALLIGLTSTLALCPLHVLGKHASCQHALSPTASWLFARTQ